MMNVIWYKKILTILFVLLLAPASYARVYLVAVGVSDYPGSISDLYLPINDVKVITSIYNKSTNVTLCKLLDDKATIKNINAAMNIFNLADVNDIIVLYFSGHGYQGGFAVYDGYLSYSDIRHAMAKSKCKNKIILADACFSGGIGVPSDTLSDEVQQAKKANVLLFLSSRYNEYSWQRSDMKNAYFTNFLQKGLRGEADKNRDRIITAQEIFMYVHRNVVEISDGQQHPVMWGNFSNQMPVIQWIKR